MATYSNTAREVEMPNGDVVVLHSAPTGGANTTSNIKKFKYDDNGHVTESEAANATDLNLNSYSTPTTGSTAIGTSDAVQTAIGKLDHQSQIDQSNILFTLNRTGKNLARELPTHTVNGVTLTNNGDGTYTITRTASSYDAASFIFGDNSNGKLTGCILTGGAVGYGLKGRIGNTSSSAVSSTDWTTPKTIPSEATGVISIGVDANENPQNVQVRPFICEADVYAIDPSFIKPALPNYDLTRLEAEDRAALAEEIDAGAKNKFIPEAGTQAGITAVVNSDNSLNVTWTAIGSSNAYCRINDNNLKLPVGTYVLSGLTESGTLNYYLHLEDSAGNIIGNVAYNTPNRYLEFTVTDATRYYKMYIGVEANASAQSTAKKVYPMICTKAAFGVSNKFVPYRPNWDLVSSATNIVENSLKPWANLKSGDNLDNVISMMYSKGVWRMFAAGTNDVLNKPTSGIFFVRTLMIDTNTGIQIVTMLTGNDRGKSYSRTYAGGWDSWKETTNV